MEQRTYTLTNELVEKIEKIAEVEQRSLSNMVRVLLEEAFKNRESKK